MIIDPDKLKGKQTRSVLQSAMADLTGHIEEIEESLEQADDTDLDAEEREDYRETAASELEELFTEFEALARICSERLT